MLCLNIRSLTFQGKQKVFLTSQRDGELGLNRALLQLTLIYPIIVERDCSQKTGIYFFGCVDVRFFFCRSLTFLSNWCQKSPSENHFPILLPVSADRRNLFANNIDSLLTCIIGKLEPLVNGIWKTQKITGTFGIDINEDFTSLSISQSFTFLEQKARNKERKICYSHQ